MSRPRAILCTGNAHKLDELRGLLPMLELEALPAGVELPPETGDTFEDNARIKAEGGFAALAARGEQPAWVIADDSGLEVDVLGGAPGVRSARFAGEDATDEQNNRLLLDVLRAHPAPEQRHARFRCVLVAIGREGRELVADGTVEGAIATTPAGSGGFGYDPLFIPVGEQRTFGELGGEVKSRMSHRARAAGDLARQLDPSLRGAARPGGGDAPVARVDGERRGELVGPAPPTVETGPAAERRKRRAAMLSVGASTLLTIAKIVVAGATGSVAVLSEALHSLTDLLAAGIALLAISRADAPPDTRHRYGHEKLENLSAVVEGMIILAAVTWIAVFSVRRLITGTHVHTPLLAAAVMLASAGINWLVSRNLRRVGAATGSPALTADGRHLMADVYTSLGAGVGLALVAVTGYGRIDALVALGVAAIVVRMGAHLVSGGLRVLLDEALPEDEVRLIERVLEERFAGRAGFGFHRLRTRQAGARRHVDLHLTLDGSLSLDQAHDIAMEVEYAIADALPNTDVLTHLEPDAVAPPPGEDVGPDDTV